MLHASRLFDRIFDPNISLCNAMLKGYAQNDAHKQVVLFFTQMKSRDILPNCYTFPIIVKSCMIGNTWREGEEMHCALIKGGYGANCFVGISLIEFYSSRQLIEDAYKVFDEMPERNVVAWTAMISGYVLRRDVVAARGLFELAPERDIVLWNTMISAYIQMGEMVQAKELFDRMPNKDVMAWNTVLNGFATFGDLDAFERLFEEMPKRNVFSWNGLVGGYARNGRFSEVLCAFKRMLTDGNVHPNDATLVTVLSACARLGALDLGKWVHVYADNNGYNKNIFVGNALIDMYAKCGTIENAFDVFNRMHKKDLITWNTIIGGLAMHGRGVDALSLFRQMMNAGVEPDGITYIATLCACTHMGLVEQGISYFQSMVQDHFIEPQIVHYGCMVDLLGRSGLLAEAVDMVKKMPMEADAVIWAALLGACRVYKNVEFAELALENLIKLEPQNPANFAMLSNIYGELGKWKDVAKLKVAMRDTGFKKLPGCSLIEVNDGVIEFYSLDQRHPETKGICEALKGLTKLLKSHGYVPDIQEYVQRT